MNKRPYWYLYSGDITKEESTSLKNLEQNTPLKFRHTIISKVPFRGDCIHCCLDGICNNSDHTCGGEYMFSLVDEQLGE